MIIQLTEQNGNKIYLNEDTIVTISKPAKSNGAKIVYQQINVQKTLFVVESPEEVYAKLTPFKTAALAVGNAIKSGVSNWIGALTEYRRK